MHQQTTLSPDNNKEHMGGKLKTTEYFERAALELVAEDRFCCSS